MLKIKAWYQLNDWALPLRVSYIPPYYYAGDPAAQCMVIVIGTGPFVLAIKYINKRLVSTH